MSTVTDGTTEDETTEPVEPVEDPTEEEAEEEETPQTPDEEETPELAALSDKEIEKITQRLEGEATRHANRVTEIMGEAALYLVPCELCETVIPGFRYPQIPDGDPREPLYALLAQGDTAQLVQDADAERCDRCAGHGETLTGSLNPIAQTIPCRKCKGKGWTSPQDRQEWKGAEAAASYVAPSSDAPAVVPAPEDERPMFDAYGRPRTHEFYGRGPEFMSAAERERDPYLPKG